MQVWTLKFEFIQHYNPNYLLTIIDILARDKGTYQLSHIYDKLLLPLWTSSREQLFGRRQQLLPKHQ